MSSITHEIFRLMNELQVNCDDGHWAKCKFSGNASRMICLIPLESYLIEKTAKN